jgi:hypothetical protein
LYVIEFLLKKIFNPAFCNLWFPSLEIMIGGRDANQGFLEIMFGDGDANNGEESQSHKATTEA